MDQNRKGLTQEQPLTCQEIHVVNLHNDMLPSLRTAPERQERASNET